MPTTWRKRKRTSKESYRFKYTSLTPNNVMDLKKIEELKDVVQAAELSDCLDDIDSSCLMALLDEQKTDILYCKNFVYARPAPRRNRTIDSFMEADIPSFFRCRTRSDLRVLLGVLEMPPTVILPNKQRVTAEECMLGRTWTFY